jgi:hypothetical protein
MGYPLASVSATFASDGLGGTVCRAVASPTRAGISWNVEQISSQVNPPSVPSSRLKVHRGPESKTTYLEGTFTADDDSTDTKYTLGPTDFLTLVWTGGTLGAVATATIHGTATDRRNQGAI